jgi:hypothetical protein
MRINDINTLHAEQIDNIEKEEKLNAYLHIYRETCEKIASRNLYIEENKNVTNFWQLETNMNIEVEVYKNTLEFIGDKIKTLI